MSEREQFSATTSIFCRLMQLVTILAAAFILYVVMADAEQQFPDFFRYHWSELTQDQANLVIISDTKTSILESLNIFANLTGMLVFIGLFRVFGRFASRPFQLRKAAQVVRFLGVMLLLKAVIDFLVLPTALYTLTFDNPAGSRALAFGFHPAQITYFLLGLGLIVAGHLTVSAAKNGMGFAGLGGSGESDPEFEDDVIEEAFDAAEPQPTEATEIAQTIEEDVTTEIVEEMADAASTAVPDAPLKID